MSEAMYEDDLPEGITDAEYDLWFSQSRIVDGVRMGPRLMPNMEYMATYADDLEQSEYDNPTVIFP